MDYRAFRKYLYDKYHVEKALYFIGYVPTNADVYKSLQDFGYTMIFKPTLEIRGQIKGNVDAELVLHAMLEYKNYDKAVIVSGDGDFHCLIKHWEKTDKLLKILVPDSKKYSSLLRSYAPYIAGVDQLKRKISRA